MINKIGCMLAGTVLSLASQGVLAATPISLEVELTDGCPSAVISLQETCVPGQPDPRNEACQVDNGPVRWTSAKPIASIGPKSGSEAGMKACQPVAGVYQCVVLGTVNTRVDYYVTLEDPDCATLDPTIIIR